MHRQVGIPVKFTMEVVSTDTGEWDRVELWAHVGKDDKTFSRVVLSEDVSHQPSGAFGEGVAVVGLMQAFDRVFEGVGG